MYVCVCEVLEVEYYWGDVCWDCFHLTRQPLHTSHARGHTQITRTKIEFHSKEILCPTAALIPVGFNVVVATFQLLICVIVCPQIQMNT